MEALKGRRVGCVGDERERANFGIMNVSSLLLVSRPHPRTLKISKNPWQPLADNNASILAKMIVGL